MERSSSPVLPSNSQLASTSSHSSPSMQTSDHRIPGQPFRRSEQDKMKAASNSSVSIELKLGLWVNRGFEVESSERRRTNTEAVSCDPGTDPEVASINRRTSLEMMSRSRRTDPEAESQDRCTEAEAVSCDLHADPEAASTDRRTGSGVASHGRRTGLEAESHGRRTSPEIVSHDRLAAPAAKPRAVVASTASVTTTNSNTV